MDIVPEVAVGYSLFGGLVVLSIQLIRRTREIDRRRDELAETEMEIARQLASQAADEREHAIEQTRRLWQELRAAQAELTRHHHDHPHDTGTEPKSGPA